MNESPEEKYCRLQREIQGAILQNYPNLERRGCPGGAMLRELAAHPDRIRTQDEANVDGAWHHITHCSPCYLIFLELRNDGRDHRRARKTAPVS